MNKLNLFSWLELPLTPFLKILTLHLCGVSVVTTMQETRFLDHGKWISICVFSFLMDKSRMLTVPVFSALGIEVFIFWTQFLRISTLIKFFFDSVKISLKQNNALARTIASYGVSFVFTGNCAVQSALHRVSNLTRQSGQVPDRLLESCVGILESTHNLSKTTVSKMNQPVNYYQ